MKYLQQIPEGIKQLAKSLQDVGLNEVAWPLGQVTKVIAALNSGEFAILGGDLYTERAGRLTSMGDSWHCDRRKDEPREAYRQRSLQQALAYVMAYPYDPNKNQLVVLVTSDAPTAGYMPSSG